METPFVTDLKDQTADLAALVGSRLCHDLISPIGAIGNGLELLELSGTAGSEEMDLIRASVTAASARVQFYRIAFGSGASNTPVPLRDVQTTLAGHFADSRASVKWDVDGPAPRDETRLAFLALSCLEMAMAWGGTIEVRRQNGVWVIHARADRFRIEEQLWEGLARGRYPDDLTGGQVQFGLLVEAMRAIRRPISVTRKDTSISLLV